ncbi:hypothetical protein ACMYZ5_12015, partial [Bacteroides sp. KG68]|uniref:hypothetical protein n=1 Tax=Bacteroides sp. KG68 TaxID=3397824 RepID=UPI003D97D305
KAVKPFNKRLQEILKVREITAKQYTLLLSNTKSAEDAVIPLKGTLASSALKIFYILPSFVFKAKGRPKMRDLHPSALTQNSSAS